MVIEADLEDARSRIGRVAATRLRRLIHMEVDTDSTRLLRISVIPTGRLGRTATLRRVLLTLATPLDMAVHPNGSQVSKNVAMIGEEEEEVVVVMAEEHGEEEVVVVMSKPGLPWKQGRCGEEEGV